MQSSSQPVRASALVAFTASLCDPHLGGVAEHPQSPSPGPHLPPLKNLAVLDQFFRCHLSCSRPRSPTTRWACRGGFGSSPPALTFLFSLEECPRHHLQFQTRAWQRCAGELWAGRECTAAGWARRCARLIPWLRHLLYRAGGQRGQGWVAGLAAGVGHPSWACLCSGSLFGEFADDTNEGSVLVLQPLVV